MKFSLKRSLLICVAVFALLLTACSDTSSASTNKAFMQFTDELFRQEISTSTISLHYTLKNPDTYALQHCPVTYGTISSDITQAQTSIENYQSALHSFSYEQLTEENQLTYQVLDYYLETSKLGSSYLLYQEPLSPTIGIHAQLPILLAEFPFYNASDVDTYLQLLDTTDNYFQSIIDFEIQKSEVGLFMSDRQVDEIISNCHSFLNMGEANYLYGSFETRLEALSTLGTSDKESYIAHNKELIETKVFPSYENLIASLTDLKGTGTNPNGLYYFPDGTAYYEYLVRQTVGITDSIPFLLAKTKQQILADLADIEQLLFPTSVSENASILDSLSPVALLNDLKEKTAKAFPEIPSVITEIKYVPSDMEEYLSPAFYMIPAIDNYENNVIYINQSQVYDSLELYTTLAHEGYPGHLYQTVYFHATDPAPIRSLLDFGGYVEGWATYVEMMSYYMAPLSQEEATLLQKNQSLTLGLYAYADMSIHYNGWTQQDLSAFFSTYGISDPQVLESIYQLIVGTPGNYLKYYLGYLEFYDLKKEILGELQKEFSQKEFHKAVLDVGPAPFEILKKYVYQELLPESSCSSECSASNKALIRSISSSVYTSTESMVTTLIPCFFSFK